MPFLIMAYGMIAAAGFFLFYIIPLCWYRERKQDRQIRAQVHRD